MGFAYGGTTFSPGASGERLASRFMDAGAAHHRARGSAPRLRSCPPRVERGRGDHLAAAARRRARARLGVGEHRRGAARGDGLRRRGDVHGRAEGAHSSVVGGGLCFARAAASPARREALGARVRLGRARRVAVGRDATRFRTAARGAAQRDRRGCARVHRLAPGGGSRRGLECVARSMRGGGRRAGGPGAGHGRDAGSHRRVGAARRVRGVGGAGAVPRSRGQGSLGGLAATGRDAVADARSGAGALGHVEPRRDLAAGPLGDGGVVRAFGQQAHGLVDSQRSRSTAR